jgi:arylsulfatase A-like enzyme
MRVQAGVQTSLRSAPRWALLLMFLLLGCGIGRAEPPTGYNVLLISLDTLRADHLSCYGYKRATSPRIDEVAKEGVLFENAVAASNWTVPSHMSMLTSLYPSWHGVETTKSHLGDAVPTLAQVLAKQGYTTAAFVTGSSLDHKFGFSHGFQLYDDFTAISMCETNLFEDHPANSTTVFDVPTDHVITNLATLWLKKHGQEKFFLFLHYWDCHSDYIPPAPYDRLFDPGYKGKENGRNVFDREKEIESGIAPRDLAHLMALYDGEIAHTDDHVGQVLQLLREMGLAEKTLLIIVADHGEGFLEHGKIFHGNTLFEELIHVPLILRLPGVIPAGRRIKDNVSQVDLMPTVLRLLGVPQPEGLQGIDLSGACRGLGGLPDRILFSESAYDVLPRSLRAARWGPYKLIQQRGRPPMPLLVVGEGGESDAEKAGLDDKQRHKLEDVLTKAIATAGPSGSEAPNRAAEPAKMDEATLRRLKSLGYVQ